MFTQFLKSTPVFPLLVFCLISALPFSVAAQNSEKTPIRLCIVGLTHGHAGGFLNAARDAKEIAIVGVQDASEALFAKYAKDFSLAPELYFSDVDEMLEKTKPQGVAIFSSTFDHPRIVELCAARGIPVMMEKPLAVSMEHARRIESAALQGKIPVIVNYETTWYPSNRLAYEMVHTENAFGDLRKIVVRDGHQGPTEIGCPPEFIEWLTDPVWNGAGALFDFGCYGANLITWLMQNQRPLSVSAVTQQIKPDVYPKVDDEAVIILTYPHMQGIIQASWNWPFNRKDMEVYGKTGYAFADNSQDMRIRREKQEEIKQSAPPLPPPYNSSIAYFSAVIRGEIQPEGLSSLENNLIVTEILDAARESAKTGKTILLKHTKNEEDKNGSK